MTMVLIDGAPPTNSLQRKATQKQQPLKAHPVAVTLPPIKQELHPQPPLPVEQLKRRRNRLQRNERRIRLGARSYRGARDKASAIMLRVPLI